MRKSPAENPAGDFFIKSERQNERELPPTEVHLLPRLKSGKDISNTIGELDGEDTLQRIYDQINEKKL